MRRRAATLAGLLLVAIPSTIAMGSGAGTGLDDGTQNATPAYQQFLENAPASKRHHGRKCHRKDGRREEQRRLDSPPDV